MASINDEFGNTTFDPEITDNTFNKFFFYINISMKQYYQSNHSNEYNSKAIDHTIESKNPNNIDSVSQGSALDS